MKRFPLFLSVTLSVTVASLIWHALFFWEFWPCISRESDAWSWLTNEITYSVIHPISFSIAVGLFVVHFRASQSLPPSPIGKAIAFGILVVFLLLILWVGVPDLLAGYLQSYELKNPCAALKDDRDLHDLAEKKKEADD